MITRFTGLLAIVALMLSCSTDPKMLIARGGEQCELHLPEYMNPATLSDSLEILKYKGKDEAINEVKILSDDKKNLNNLGVMSTREEFYFRFADDITLQNNQYKIGKPQHESIGLYSAIRGEIIHPSEFHYTVMVTETATKFFTIVVKVKSKNRAKMMKETEQILESFKEITEFKAQSGEEQP